MNPLQLNNMHQEPINIYILNIVILLIGIYSKEIEIEAKIFTERCSCLFLIKTTDLSEEGNG